MMTQKNLTGCPSLLLLLLLWTSLAFAQRYPATTSIQLIPPYSTDLEKYAQAGNDRLLTTVVFNDFSQSSWNVKLRITIESGSVRLQTNPEAPVKPINLIPGTPEQFSGFDLADYLNYNSMVMSGISSEDIIRKGGLPDGLYTITLEALDFRTGIPISNKATATAWFILNDPPQITFPACGEHIPYMDPQNISFQWLPMHLSSPNSSFNTEYEFTIVEMPEGLNANEAILSGMPLLNTIVNANNFLYSTGEPLLENGKNYAFRIRATDSENLSLFKNEGYSQVCWFTYGYSVNGSITVVRPLDGALVNVNTQPTFGWSAPSNLVSNQPVSYAFKIFELADGQSPEEAVDGNAVPFYEETTSESPNSIGFARRLTEELEPEKSYVWQAKAFTAGIEIATTPPLRFSTTPVIQQFNAGQHIVRIESITNQDLENFSGRGRVKVLPDGTEVEFAFAALKIISAAGKLLMNGGEISFDLPETFEDIELAPADEVNGNAFFRAKAIRITKNEMSISGTAEWALPFPVISGQQAWVKSEFNFVNFDNLKLNGYIKLDNSNFFKLLDPFGFDLKLLAGSSNFFLRENQFTQNFDSEVTLPQSVKGKENASVKTTLKQVHQLFSNEVTSLDGPIVPIAKVDMHLIPTHIVLDFSEQSSPEKYSSTPSWKGAYFKTFEVEYLSELDKNQLHLSRPIKHSFTQTTDEKLISCVDGEGLDFSFEKEFDQSDVNYSTFNQFAGKLKSVSLMVEDNQLMSGQFIGEILIPVLHEKYFDYIITLSTDGFEEGYLKEELTGTAFTMDDGKADQVVNTITQATFAGHDRLDLVIDVEWPRIATKMANVQNFTIWGNGLIGFGTPFGRTRLSTVATGNLHNYPVQVTQLGAGFHEGRYFLNAESEISISPDLSGANGPTTISLYATTQVSENSLSRTDTLGFKLGNDKSSVQGGLKGGYNINLIGNSQVRDGDLMIDSSFVKMDVFLGQFEGYLKLTTDDPDWGASWQGSFAFNMRLPVQARLEAAYVAGRTPEGVDYWLMDVGMASDGPDGSRDAKMNAGSRAGSQFRNKIPKTRSFKQDPVVASDAVVSGNNAPPSDPSGKPVPNSSVPSTNEAPPSSPSGIPQPTTPAVSQSGSGTPSNSGSDQGNLSLGPVNVVGFDLRLYRHMSHTGAGDVSAGASGLEMTFEPDESVIAGVYGRVALVDGQTSGSVFKMDMALEYTRLTSGKGIYGYEGNLEISSGGKGFTGSGKLLFNEEEKHWLGDFWMVVAIPDKLCLEAGLAFDVKPSYWKIGIGSPERRVIITPKCQGWSPTGYFIIDSREFELGLGVAYVGSISSPTIDIFGNTFLAKADFGFSAGAVIGIQYQPSFVFKKAGLWVEGWGAVAVDYNTLFADGTWVFASVKLAGTLTMLFEDKTKMEGLIKGEVEVIGIGLDFSMALNHTFQ